MRLSSRWLLLGCFIIVALVCARLGFWQLDRLRQRRAANVVAQAKRAMPPVPIRPANVTDAALAGRRVVAAGRYDTSHTIVLRGRVFQGVPGVEIVSPLLLEDSRTAVLVNRGFVPSPDAFTIEPDSLREPGPTRVQGIALPISSTGGAPLQHGRQTTWARLDRSTLPGRLPYPISPVYIVQLPDSTLPRFPRRLDPPALDEGPHRSYAIQWFSFSLMALVFGIVIAKQQRERDKNGRERGMRLIP
jgi:surfeit locus 1 family protein